MLTVKDIMTTPVVVIRSNATVENAIWLMRANRVRSLVVETSPDGGCYGIVTSMAENMKHNGHDRPNSSKHHMSLVVFQPSPN